jgi:hypothetical protein
MFVPVKIDRGKGKICQEMFLHDFLCELTCEYIRIEPENIRDKVSVSEVTNFGFGTEEAINNASLAPCHIQVV